MNYILVDTANTFFRARHVIKGALNEKIGMALHITLNSIRRVWQEFKGDHVVFCLEGKSWRRDVYPRYKMNRKTCMAPFFNFDKTSFLDAALDLTSTGPEDKIQYNWPYDFFSLVELVKIDASVEFFDVDTDDEGQEVPKPKVALEANRNIQLDTLFPKGKK